MKKILSTVVLTALLTLSCQDKKTTNSFQSKFNKEKSGISPSEKKDGQEVPAQQTDKGFVVLKNTYQQKDFIQLYNEDYSIWKSFQMTDTFHDDNIIPYSMKPENTLLVFKFLGKENGLYKVLVNEDKNTIKYIKVSDSNFVYQTAGEHILTVFSVDFNEKENPLRTAPDSKALSQPLDKDSFYYPVKIEGSWLMVKDDHDHNFWIKWCDEKGHLILDLYYDA
ncbi:hypothetical protein [Chryseobacterium jejuense]|uniref:hypothetical protein n=1 Tax=Chryseobacterium jejuense TaxID=445960 RepID=UPI001AE2EBDD|nr:hypothetical protein [Chryseobacterium jejuense]MBP2615886.1 hypothetical protein [Chryseobacterium jejuense]